MSSTKATPAGRQEKTIADIVSDNIKTSHIFKKYGIDFCCGGGVTVQKACERKGVDYAMLTEELRHFDMEVKESYDYLNWPLDVLIDHIISVHHLYIEENSPLLLQYIEKVAKVHGHHYTELHTIKDLFTEFSNELSAHIKHEESTLFPFIKKMMHTEREDFSLDSPYFKTLKDCFTLLEKEHEIAGDVFNEIAHLTNNYTPPKDACNTFRALYDKLEEFDQDLYIHINLENNILYPKALQLENKLRD